MNRELLNNDERINHTDRLFGVHFPFRLEPTIFDITGRLSADYRGGYWHMYRLGNGGFFMAPDADSFRLSCPNGYKGILSGDAFGIVACLYAYSELSFSGVPGFADACAEQYHLLRDSMFEHPEVTSILRAID
jgi:hypothetical protein